MKTTTYTINGNEYKVYEINFKGQTINIGDNKLNDLIMDIIEKEEKYVETQVTNEFGETMSLMTLDETIVAFLGEEMENPTEEQIIENVFEILDEG